MRVKCDNEGVERAVRAIHRGGVVIFPTDTVYGIGCDPYDKMAVERIYEIKSRGIGKQVPVLVDSVETAERISELDGYAKKLAKRFWPGPLTIIVKVTDKKIKESLGLGDGIALRVPDHECTQEMLKKCNLLVGTSANISGDLPHTDPEECLKGMSGYDVFVDGGTITSGGESTIIDTRDGRIKIVREGSLTKDAISVV